ncbi:MAG TPA: RDD family protein [Ktedonobacterales bacterium]
MDRPVASVGRRMAAFMLDYLLISVYLALLVAMGVGLGQGPLQSLFHTLFADPNRSELSAFLLLVLPVFLYFLILESSPWQATVGKRVLGLRVTGAQRNRLNFPRALARSALAVVPWELIHARLWRIPGWPLAPTTPAPIIVAGLVLVGVLLAVYLATMLLSKKHQALYDTFTSAYVIKASGVP